MAALTLCFKAWNVEFLHRCRLEVVERLASGVELLVGKVHVHFLLLSINIIKEFTLVYNLDAF
jgi:hypothetical protein